MHFRSRIPISIQVRVDIKQLTGIDIYIVILIIDEFITVIVYPITHFYSIWIDVGIGIITIFTSVKSISVYI